MWYILCLSFISWKTLKRRSNNDSGAWHQWLVKKLTAGIECRNGCYRILLDSDSGAWHQWLVEMTVVPGTSGFMTSNAPDGMYDSLVKNYQGTMFDPEAKKLRHESVFPETMKKVYEMGAALVR